MARSGCGSLRGHRRMRCDRCRRRQSFGPRRRRSLRIIDRDFVEPSNLQRQTLFDEADAPEALPKAVAAERKLRSINSAVAVEGVVADLSPGNVTTCSPVSLSSSWHRQFRNSPSHQRFRRKLRTPWIYAAAVASYGLTMTILPGVTPCLACLLDTQRQVSKKPATPSASWAPS